MRTAHLLLIVFGMAACTHTQNDCVTTKLKDTTNHTRNLSQHTPAAPPVVAPVNTDVNMAPELPLFKDALDPKRLFW